MSQMPIVVVARVRQMGDVGDTGITLNLMPLQGRIDLLVRPATHPNSCLIL